MKDSSATTAAAPQVPIPGMWHLAWLLFMQPIRLHRLHKELGARCRKDLRGELGAEVGEDVGGELAQG